jgi:hypothetical protein
MPPVKKHLKGKIGLMAGRNVTDIGAVASTYLTINDQIKNYNREKGDVQKELKDYLEKHYTVDGNGNQVVYVRYGNIDILLQNSVRTSLEVRGDAIRIVRRTPELNKWAKDLIKTAEYFDEGRLEELVENGSISEALAKKLVKESESYTFSVKKKKL